MSRGTSAGRWRPPCGRSMGRRRFPTRSTRSTALPSAGMRSIPRISPSWLADWDRLRVLGDYPPAIRRAIYTTNAIESLHLFAAEGAHRAWGLPQRRGHRHTVVHGTATCGQKGDPALPEWKAALNQFVILSGSGCKCEKSYTLNLTTSARGLGGMAVLRPRLPSASCWCPCATSLTVVASCTPARVCTRLSLVLAIPSCAPVSAAAPPHASSVARAFVSVSSSSHRV